MMRKMPSTLSEKSPSNSIYCRPRDMSVSLYRTCAKDHFFDFFSPFDQLFISRCNVSQYCLPLVCKPFLKVHRNFWKPDFSQVCVVHTLLHPSDAVEGHQGKEVICSKHKRHEIWQKTAFQSPYLILRARDRVRWHFGHDA